MIKEENLTPENFFKTFCYQPPSFQVLEKPRGGWFREDNREMLQPFMGPDVKVIVEIGCWMGKSTRWIMDQSPNAKMIAVDTWLGAVEHQADPYRRRELATLFDTFLVNCQEYADRLHPLRCDSLTGLLTIAKYGVKPDVIHIDASHEYRSVYSDVLTALESFPGTPIVGDDWDWPQKEVETAVRDAVKDYPFSLKWHPYRFEILHNKHAYAIRPTKLELENRDLLRPLS